MSAWPQFEYASSDCVITLRAGNDRGVRLIRTDAGAAGPHPRHQQPPSANDQRPAGRHETQASVDPHHDRPPPSRDHHRLPPESDTQATQAVPRQARAGRRSPAGAKRRIRLGPIAFWTTVGVLAIMAGCSIGTATYFAFRDDLVTRLTLRQADLQAAYEDRLTEMRAQVDRIATREALDHEQIGQKFEQVLRRQSVLEQRAGTLGALGEPSLTGSVKSGSRSADEPTAVRSRRTRESTAPTPPADRHTGLAPKTGATPSAVAANPEVERKLVRLMSALDRVEQRQVAALTQMEESYENRVRRIRSLFAEIGIGSGKGTDAGTGGPYVPVKLTVRPEDFERQVHRVQVARAQLERLSRTLPALPIRRPVSGEVDMSSTFGMRIDPFMGRPALHTGIDFRGEVGEAIRATGSGTVVSADSSGGYGRMVEINHGNGLTTRYGHLSNIVVQVGQVVKTGQVVGRMGSTGRSTGPHLHYETRVDGAAVDPQKFLRAGSRFGSL